jgi:hypothetical protein
MNAWILSIGVILYAAVVSSVTLWIVDNDGYFKKRKLHKRLDDIMYYQSHKDEKQIVITYKDKSFTIKANDCKHNSYYKTIALYINEELVLTLHVLEGTFICCRTVEANRKRYRREVVKIVKTAVKRSKKEREVELFKSYNIDSKSYFK